MRRVNNKSDAFKSLSDRNMKVFGVNNATKESKTYGGILCTMDNEGELLFGLVQGRRTGKWSFPKGHSDENENGLECALREIMEETGIKNLPKPIDYLEVGYGKYYVFELKTTQPMVAIDKMEVMNTGWMGLDEMRKVQVNADVYKFVQRMCR